MDVARDEDLHAFISRIRDASSINEAVTILRQFALSQGFEVSILPAGRPPSAGARGSSYKAPEAAPASPEILGHPRPESGESLFDLSPVVPLEVAVRMVKVRDSSDGGEPGELQSSSDSAATVLLRTGIELFALKVAAIEANTRLNYLSQRLKEFISTLHHDVRTPLTSIAGMAQTLRMRPSIPDEIRDEFFQRIEGSAQTIETMTDAFRAALDASCAAVSEPWSAIDVVVLLTSRVTHLLAGQTDAEVRLPSAPLFVKGPPKLLSDCIDAVLKFALAWIRKGFSIAAGPEGNILKLSVSGTTDLDSQALQQLPNLWVPEGTLVAEGQVEAMSRPYNVFRVLGGGLEATVSGETLLIEAKLPLEDSF
jgi:hypothetical protein